MEFANKVKNRIKNKNFLTFVLMIMYAYVFDYIIKTFMFGLFSYMMTYTYRDMSIERTLLYLFLASFPILLYKGYNYLASIISFFVYILIYVPFIHILFVADYPSELSVLYIIFFFVFMCVAFLTDNITFGRTYMKSAKKKITLKKFERVVVLLLLIAVIMNISNMHFVNFLSDAEGTLYDLRAVNNTNSNAISDYLCRWLSQFLLPCLLVSYMIQKDYKKAAIPFVGCVCMYMIDLLKATLVVPIMTILFYFLYKRNPQSFNNNFHIYIIVALMVLPLILISSEGMETSAITALLVMRTQCIAEVEFSQYFDFFQLQNNPYTYYTHIGVIGSLTGAYPYKQPLGYVVSGGAANSNATFFLTDGMAGGGIVSCIFIAIIFIVLKSYLNSVGDYYNKGLVTIILFFPIASLANVSLFTALLTGGFIVAYFVFRNVDIYTLYEPSIYDR